MSGLSFFSENDTDWQRPSVYVQWKGTDVCLDFHCICDTEEETSGVGHYDGYNAYGIMCVRCGRKYELPSELPLKLVDEPRWGYVEIEPDKSWS